MDAIRQGFGPCFIDDIRGNLSIEIIGLGVPFSGIWQGRGNIGSDRLMFFHEPLTVTVETKELQTKGSTLFFFPKNCRVSYGQPNSRWHHSWLRFTGTLFKNLWVARDLPYSHPIPMDDSEVFLEYLRVLMGQLNGIGQRKENKRVPQRLSQLVGAQTEVLILKIDHILRPSAEAARVRHQDPLERARTYIHQHYTKALTLNDLSCIAGLSKAHLSYAYKKRFGQTPFEERQILQIQLAVRLLKETRLTQDEIARECGLCDGLYLSRLVKKRTGQAPSKIR